jgi:hypothetical protein
MSGGVARLDHHGLSLEHQPDPGRKQGARGLGTGEDAAILGHPTLGCRKKYWVWELQAWKRYKCSAGPSVLMDWLYVN